LLLLGAAFRRSGGAGGGGLLAAVGRDRSQLRYSPLFEASSRVSGRLDEDLGA